MDKHRYDLENTSTLSGKQIWSKVEKHRSSQRKLFKIILIVAVIVAIVLAIIGVIKKNTQWYLMAAVIGIMGIGYSLIQLGSSRKEGFEFVKKYMDEQTLKTRLENMEFKYIEDDEYPNFAYNDEFVYIGGELIPWIIIDHFEAELVKDEDYYENREVNYRDFHGYTKLYVVTRAGFQGNKHYLTQYRGLHEGAFYLANILNMSFKPCQEKVNRSNFESLLANNECQVQVRDNDSCYKVSDQGLKSTISKVVDIFKH